MSLMTHKVLFPLFWVPPAGFEPALPPPEGGALSPELRGLSDRDRLAGSSLGVPTTRYGAGMSSPPRVLVVDDEVIIRQLIVINLELEGFEVHTAADGLEALARAREVRPQVITLDVMMPNLDGWTTAQRLRSDPETRDARIVFISARGRAADVSRGMQLGEAYLTKPFDPDEVVEAVRRLAGTGPVPDGGAVPDGGTTSDRGIGRSLGSGSDSDIG